MIMMTMILVVVVSSSSIVDITIPSESLYLATEEYNELVVVTHKHVVITL